MIDERVGLTLGKFAPLHRGHQYLIETALAETERLVVLIYDCPVVGAHVSLALGAEDRRVDTDRDRFPVSGTDIRQAPFEHRHWLAPGVYRDLVRNVVLLGAPRDSSTVRNACCSTLTGISSPIQTR